MMAISSNNSTNNKGVWLNEQLGCWENISVQFKKKGKGENRPSRFLFSIFIFSF